MMEKQKEEESGMGWGQHKGRWGRKDFLAVAAASELRWKDEAEQVSGIPVCLVCVF